MDRERESAPKRAGINEIQLDRRGQEILEAVIASYIETGEPVGSRTVSKLNREGLSPATIRNVMAELEESDLLSQPHPSAGRVPTDLGYRVYVDSLMKRRRLARAEEQLIATSFTGDRIELPELFSSVSRLLSSLSHHTGVVVSPNVARARLKEIEFVRLGPHRVLVILVAIGDMIYNKVVEIGEDHKQERLDSIGRYLSGEFRGNTLPEIRDRILEMMTREKALYDSMLRDALALGRVSLEKVGPSDSDQVFLDGTTNLLSEPEFTSVSRLQALFRTFEEKHELLKVLNSLISQESHGVKVIIGSENPNPDMSDCALIASSYGVEGETLGTLGIIGPTRMEYARAIALVDSVARLFSRALGRYQS